MREALARFLADLGYEGWGLSVLLTDDATLRELNRAHRGRDAATDVLSWGYRDQDGPDASPEEGRLLGDLALSLERAADQARANGWPLRTEVLRLLAHGCAHLAGYDHESEPEEREMRGREEALLEAVGLKGIYPEGAPSP